MPENPNSPRRSQPAPPALISSGHSECRKMSDNVTHIPNSNPGAPAEKSHISEINRGDVLSRRQRSALPVIAASPTIRHAARAIEINERTLYRWLEDEDFRHELARQREEAANLARQELQGLMLRSVVVLAEAMEAPDLALRLRAARYALSFAARIGEAEKLAVRLQELEEVLTSG